MGKHGAKLGNKFEMTKKIQKKMHTLHTVHAPKRLKPLFLLYIIPIIISNLRFGRNRMCTQNVLGSYSADR